MGIRMKKRETIKRPQKSQNKEMTGDQQRIENVFGGGRVVNE